MTLLGNRISADVISLDEVILLCTLNPMTGVLIRKRRTHRDTQRGKKSI